MAALSGSDLASGLGCCLVSVLLFGSNYLPIKRYHVGDGLFFQFCLCGGIYLVGLSINHLHPYSDSPPPFQPLSALGGVAWCTGQLLVVPIVRLIGIAKGLITWGGTAILVGWTCGAFGLLGVRSEADGIHSWVLNILGLTLALSSLLVSLLLQPTVSSAHATLEEGLLSAESGGQNSIVGHTMPNGRSCSSVKTAAASPPPSGIDAWANSMSEGQQGALGVCLSVCSGLFYGTNFNGSQYVMDRAGSPAYPDASPHGLDYAPSQFTGIFLASTSYFGAYVACRHSSRRAWLRRELILPALASGVMWGVADALWFVANEKLGFVIAFPIILAGPGAVASLWGIFYLGELRGHRNYLLSAAVAVLVSAGAVLISLSKL